MIEFKLEERELIERYTRKMEENYEFIKIEDIILQVKKGDSYEFILENYKRRSSIELREHDKLIDRDKNSINRIIERIKKLKDGDLDEMEKIIRQALRFQDVDKFPYRQLSESMKEKGFKIIKHEEIKDKENLDEIYLFVFGQTIESIDKFTIVHPKIRYILNALKRKQKEQAAS